MDGNRIGPRSSNTPLTDLAADKSDKNAAHGSLKPAVDGKQYIPDGNRDNNPAKKSFKERSVSIESDDSGIVSDAYSSDTLGKVLATDTLLNALSTSQNPKKEDAIQGLELFKKAEEQLDELTEILQNPDTSPAEKQSQLLNRTGLLAHLTRKDPPPTEPEFVIESLESVIHSVKEMIEQDKLDEDPERIIKLFASDNPCLEARYSWFSLQRLGIDDLKPSSTIDRSKSVNDILTNQLNLFAQMDSDKNSDDGGESLSSKKFRAWAMEVDGLIGSKVAGGALINDVTLDEFITYATDTLMILD